MILDMMSVTGLNPSNLLEELEEITGPYHFDRKDIAFNEQDREKKLIRITKPTFEHLGELKVLNTDTRDGLKLHLEENSWALIRFSGTEPLIRLYAEGTSPDQVKKIIENCRMIVDG